MKKATLIPRLRALNNSGVNNIGSLNCGGCGVYAARIAKALQANPSVKEVECAVIVRSMEYDPTINLDTIKQNNSKLNSVLDWVDNGVTIYHVVVRFKYRNKWWYYDSENLVNETEAHNGAFNGKVIDGHLTIDEITNLSNNPEGWNERFDRISGIPKIEKYIAQHLN